MCVLFTFWTLSCFPLGWWETFAFCKFLALWRGTFYRFKNEVICLKFLRWSFLTQHCLYIFRVFQWPRMLVPSNTWNVLLWHKKGWRPFLMRPFGPSSAHRPSPKKSGHADFFEKQQQQGGYNFYNSNNRNIRNNIINKLLIQIDFVRPGRTYNLGGCQMWPGVL